jgi:divalent metal cation (Fe/Co/Zn/Cd) transporter
MKRVPASSVKTATGQLGQINWGVYLVSDRSQKNNLTRYAWLSIGAAILTIGLKLGAYYLTNSVGLLSDALESLVNLVTAIVALIALNIAVKPADEEFAYGYSKV